jgi:hypothetical protein
MPANAAHHQGCGLRRSPGLAVMLAGNLPAALPVCFDEHCATVACQLFFPPYSRAAATVSLASATAMRLPVFPSTKSAVIVGGTDAYRRRGCPLLGYSVPRLSATAALRYIKKIKIVPWTFQTTRLHADGRMVPSPP